MAEFGIRLPVSGPLAGPSNIRIAATAAEEHGFDSVWVHDFIVWNEKLDRTHVSAGAIELIEEGTEPRMFESLMTLAWVAAATTRVKIGTAILCVPYREPVVTAKQVATLDSLSGGRLILGVGVGGTKRTNNQDFEVLGIPRTEKYGRTREGVLAMKSLWEEERPSYQGEFFGFPETTMYPKPVQSPLPIWFGGKGDKSLDLVAEFGHGWLPTWLAVDQYAELLPGLADRLAQRGRSLADLTIGKECYVCIAESAEEAEEISAATMATFSSGFTVRTEEAARASALVGNPAEVAAAVARFVEVGVQHFEMKFIFRSMDELHHQLRLFATEVAPTFR